MRKAIYAGSFDPPTNGHLWMIEQGSLLFDELLVTVGTNPSKKYMFSLEERMDMLMKIAKDEKNITVACSGKKFLVNYANSAGAEYLLRGIRNEKDYAYENEMRHVNSGLNPKITTVFLIPPKSLMETSSSAVKSMIGFDGWEEAIKGYVPEEVYKRILEKNGQK